MYSFKFFIVKLFLISFYKEKKESTKILSFLSISLSKMRYLKSCLISINI